MIRTRISSSFLRLVASCVVFIYCGWGDARCQEGRAAKASYFPLAVSNSWDYSLRGHLQGAKKRIQWKVTQREIIHNFPVFHLWQVPSQEDEPLSLAEVPGGIVEADTDRFLIKNAMRAGDRWLATSQSLRAKSKRDSFEVASSGARCTVDGHSFADCVVIKESDEANNVSSVTTYARGVGPVKYVYFKGPDFKQVDTILTIKRWRVQ